MIRIAALLATSAAGIAVAGLPFTITPLVLQNDEIEPGVLVTSIESLDVNNAGDWLLELATNAPTAFNRLIVLNGAIEYRKGFGFPAPVGGLISSFDSVRINNNAEIGWNLFFSELPSNADTGVFFNDLLLIQEGDLSQPTSGLTVPSPYIGFFETRMNDNNEIFLVGTVDDPMIVSGVDRVLAWLDYDVVTNTHVETILWKESDVLPGQSEAALDFGTGTENAAINNARQAFFSVSLSGPTATNAALYRDAELIVQKGDESPIAGRTYTNIGTSTRVDMNASGDWVFVSNISGDAADNIVIVDGGGIVAQRGTQAPGTDPGTLINNFNSAPVRIDDSGNVFWYANLTGDAATNQALYRNGDLIVRKGVAVDGLTFTSLAGSTATGGITKGFSISQDGRYMLFRGILDNGLRGAFLVTFGDPPCGNSPDLDGDGEVNGADLGLLLGGWGPCVPGAPCPADLNCDGEVDGADLGALLGAWTN
ncbi:MAG TPA: hypothetical protein PKC43_06080 [Phycisphaerales bacterium]|nr:hypothetical protein [Phycisphaerales bacterium]HMP37001.1 hypothetical protein [Phycisphaerales bacterium]